MDDNGAVVCNKCRKKLVLRRADFTYLGHSFHTDVYRCPSCNAVYIPAELAEGKMAELEMSLEEK